MSTWSIAALRTILSTETDADSDLNEELLSQIRENLEAILMLLFYTGDSGSATSDPPNDTTGVLTDTAGGYSTDEHNGRVLVMTSGTAIGNVYQIDDTTSTTMICTGDNLYSDGVRSADTYLVFYNLKNTDAHAHDGIDSPNVVLEQGSVGTDRLTDSVAGGMVIADYRGDSAVVATTYTQIAQWTVGRAGTVYARVKYKTDTVTSGYAYALIKKNGGNVEENYTNVASYQYANVSVTVASGDTIELYAKTNSAAYEADVEACIMVSNPVDVGYNYLY